MAAQGHGEPQADHSEQAPTPSSADSVGSADKDAPSFEDAARRLAEIVEQLEGDALSLEQSIALFEEGVRVNRQAQARLDEAEKRVEELLSVGPSGEPRTRAFESGHTEPGTSESGASGGE